MVTWYDAAAYCNWLSEREGLEAVYEPNADKKYGPGMKLKANYLELNGYRLPTESEWEYACRAGAVTSRYYGESAELLGKYAWYTKNSLDRWMLPVGSLKPNDLGLFDMLGNAWQWCEDRALYYSAGEDKEDIKDIKDINKDDSRVLRGGSFLYLASNVRSAYRFDNVPAAFRYNAYRISSGEDFYAIAALLLYPSPEGGDRSFFNTPAQIGWDRQSSRR